MYATALAGKGVYLRSFSGPSLKPAYGNIFTAAANSATDGVTLVEPCEKGAFITVSRPRGKALSLEYICGGSAYPISLVFIAKPGANATAERKAAESGVRAVLELMARIYECDVPRDTPATRLEVLISAFVKEVQARIAEAIRSLRPVLYAYASRHALEAAKLLKKSGRLTEDAYTLYAVATRRIPAWIRLNLPGGIYPLVSSLKYNITVGGVRDSVAMLIYEPRVVANRTVFLVALFKVTNVKAREPRKYGAPITIRADAEPVLIAGLAGYPDPDTLYRVAARIVEAGR